jgi:hypothetical protein
MNIQDLVDIFQSKIEASVKSLAKWQEEFTKDHRYAFKWSEHAFYHSANVRILEYLVAHIKSKGDGVFTLENLESLSEHLQDLVNTRAMHHSFSTSQVSNLYEVMEHKVNAEALREINGAIKYWKEV